MYPSRNKAAQIGRDTVEIIAAGCYTNRQGEPVELFHLVEAARADTATYPPNETLPRFTPSDRITTFETVNDTTLTAARALVAEGLRPVALNFASARHPGGGFYTNYAIYSPGVPVFKDDEGELFDEPYLCAFVTAPAVNVGAIRDNQRRLVRDEMRERVEKVLAIMAGHGHDAAVLGAWGCGVFKNDPEEIAELFAKALRGKFGGAFAKVVFAVLDSSEERRFIGPFEERFGAGS